MIKLPVKILDIRSVDNVMMISRETASKLNLRHTELVTIRSEKEELVSNPIVVQGMVQDDIVAISPKDANWLSIEDGDEVTIVSRRIPTSFDYIKKKIEGKSWSINEVTHIVNDISRRRLTNIEVSTFALVSQFQGFNNDELVTMTKAMAEAGTQFDWNEKVYEKHSIGGIPGNKVSPIIVAIVAAAGLLIPKTSSRAITSPSGTADTMEVMCEVKFTPEEISEIAPKTRGMIVWNAPLNLSPLDDIVIGVKRQLGIDPRDQMLASIVSTKVAMGVNNMVFDIPTGVQTKMPSRTKAIDFAHSLIGLCRQVDIGVESALTLGYQPIGFNIGPALEAKEALEVLEGRGPNAVIEKSVELAGILLEMGGLSPYGTGAKLAQEFIKNGKALAKFQQIVEAQGGVQNITSDKVELGDHQHAIKATTDGYVAGIDNKQIKRICNAAGAPREKKGGISLHVKMGEFVHAGDPLFTIYASSESKISAAIQVATSMSPHNIEGMIISRISSIKEKDI